jgi:RNA polymerase sigma factor (sigma-70 family)
MLNVPVSRVPSKKPDLFPPPAPPGDPYTVFYRRHWSFVRRFMQSLNVPASKVDDMAQEVFLICHRREVFPSRDGEARAWLTACALRVASNYRKRKYVQLECTYEGYRAPAIAPRWDEELDAIRLVSGALAQLEPTHRAVYVSAEVEELPLTKIARRLGMTRKSVEATLLEAQKGMLYWIRRRFLIH